MWMKGHQKNREVFYGDRASKGLFGHTWPIEKEPGTMFVNGQSYMMPLLLTFPDLRALVFRLSAAR